ncbi:MAG: signal peptidase II [Pseudomonadota bacterium]
MKIFRNTAVRVGLGIFALDQATKYLVVHMMNLKGVGAIDVLPPLLNFRMAWNRGINFGLLASDAETARWILIVLSIAISAWVVWWIRKEGQNRLAQISAGMLVGGALGNVIDRVIYGAVADFLNMSCCGVDNPFAFNVADIAIFAGALGLVFFTGSSPNSDAAGKSG